MDTGSNRIPAASWASPMAIKTYESATQRRHYWAEIFDTTLMNFITLNLFSSATHFPASHYYHIDDGTIRWYQGMLVDGERITPRVLRHRLPVTTASPLRYLPPYHTIFIANADDELFTIAAKCRASEYASYERYACCMSYLYSCSIW